MSAGGLARLGVRCEDASTGMATLGVYCGALVDAPSAGGGPSRSYRLPGRLEMARKRAMREDEEMLLALATLLASRRKH